MWWYVTGLVVVFVLGAAINWHWLFESHLPPRPICTPPRDESEPAPVPILAQPATYSHQFESQAGQWGFLFQANHALGRLETRS